MNSPQVLIIDRLNNPKVWVSDPGSIHWVDSSGTRSVWFWNPEGADYESAVDLPETEFSRIAERCENLKKAGHRMTICLRREDPGLGIYIPEIDAPSSVRG